MSDYQEKQDQEKVQRQFSIRRRLLTSDNDQNEKSTTSTQSVRNSFIAGWTAGVTGTLAGHPLDSLKVWVQTGRGTSFAKNQASTTMAATSPGMLSTIRRFYTGVSGPMLTVGLIQSINFTVYDATRRYWYYNVDKPNADPLDGMYRDHDSYTSVAVAGATAGAILSMITSPVLQIKTKQQTNANMSFRTALKHTLRHPTVGFGTHFAVETANRAVYFCTYEYCKRHVFANQEKDGSSSNNMSLTGRMLSAGAAGISCWVVCYPLDALRSRLYATSGAGLNVSARRMTTIMLQENGWRSFYRGFAITTLRAGPVAAAILPVYDWVLDQLNQMD